VPDDFLFTIKAPNAITLTHHYAKQSSRYKHIANQPNPHFLNMDLLKRFLEPIRIEMVTKKYNNIGFLLE
jgi:uncharacterized protein YecE (DUF72 family)